MQIQACVGESFWPMVSLISKLFILEAYSLLAALAYIWMLGYNDAFVIGKHSIIRISLPA